MDGDFCAVCADSLEWVAYGACGHKEVCSTCVARLRFICDDSHCCICKTLSDAVFVTKALGDYTHTISDFSAFPSQPKEGRVGSYWYHEDTQAFFDDVDQYKMIKAMCKLSCSVCDKADDLPSEGSKKRIRFRNIEQLKGHLFHQHRLLMCSLCLEGRKVFICEQKLYSRSQLNQHINTGDSEVDGSENERGGFMGHPKCEFCRTPFYGDNELYSHMSTEHFTCHICQRQHPGQFEYYKDYDDLEIHFGWDHFLCEDEACLAKKFIVYQSESELKRHNALEHGGRMSRSQRNAALQLPTSFRYRRGNDQERSRGRGRTFRRDTSENDLSAAIQACFAASNLDGGRVADSSSSSTRPASLPVELSEDDPLITPFESLGTTDAELTSRYREALSLNSRNAPLEESAFPPLPMAPATSQPRSTQGGSVKNTMATRLLRQNKAKTVGLVGSHAPVIRSNSTQHALPTSSNASGLVSTSGQKKLSSDNVHASSSFSNSVQDRPSLTPNVWPALNGSPQLASTSGASKLAAAANGPSLSSYSSSLLVRPNGSSSSSFGSSKNRSSSVRVSHSASAPNLVDNESFEPSATDFPPVSVAQAQNVRTGNKARTTVEDIHTANKSLVERIRFALNFDQDKFSKFKDISGEYRQGSIDAETYLGCVEEYGLSHLVIELAHLCPDVRKQKELIETYNANMVGDGLRESGRSDIQSENVKGSKKGKEKKADETGRSSTSKVELADRIMSTVRQLQSSYKATENETEVLSKDGYRAAKGKSVDHQSQAEMSSFDDKSRNGKDENDTTVGGSNQRVGENDGRNKQRKKTSKFLRARLGDGSAAAILDFGNKAHPDPDPDPNLNEGAQSNPTARGAWGKQGGSKKLFP